MNAAVHAASPTPQVPATTVDIVEIARRLAPGFAARATRSDETDGFVEENFKELKEAGLVEAAVPQEFGGLGADLPELCAMLREIGRHCGSTALAFSMHTHQVATAAWRWRHQQAAPVVPLLKRVAAERILILSSGGSDWLAGSGKAERIEGGYRITARKIFTSASVAGDILMTGAVLKGEDGREEVIHFGVPMSSPQVKVLPTWRTLAMRGTASNDVSIEGHVVPDAAVAFRRPQGEWHPVFQIIAMVAIPIIYAAYLGVAEGGRDIAVALAGKRRPGPHVIDAVGRMETELAGARFAHAGMLAAYAKAAPSPEATNEIMMGRALVARHCLATLEAAMEAAGGGAIYRENRLERYFRDVQGVRYHPMQPGQQAEYAGRMALGMDVSRSF
jgi:alkylation response protein AidB-like acyl-CoA dehydrogenase